MSVRFRRCSGWASARVHKNFSQHCIYLNLLFIFAEITITKKTIGMDKEKIKSAMNDALWLLEDECQTVELEELKDNYEEVINSLQEALEEIEKP